MSNDLKLTNPMDDYSAPSVSAVEVSVERGFAVTGPANTPSYNKETDDYD